MANQLQHATHAANGTQITDDFTPLQTCNKEIITHLRSDETNPNADLYRRLTSSSPASGYFSPNPNTARVEHSHSIPLPSFLNDELAKVRPTSLMGLLPEVGLAWLSVDSKLFLWCYDGSDDFCSFDGTGGQCIVSVGLVRPKKGA